jgi:hypothetical protein
MMEKGSLYQAFPDPTRESGKWFVLFSEEPETVGPMPDMEIVRFRAKTYAFLLLEDIDSMKEYVKVLFSDSGGNRNIGYMNIWNLAKLCPDFQTELNQCKNPM